MIRYMIPIILLVLFPTTGISANITAGDVREAVIDAFYCFNGIRCSTGPGRTVVWYCAQDKMVQVKAGKKIQNPELRKERKMVPEGFGWLVEMYGPFDNILSQYKWGSRSGSWEETWDIDGRKFKFRRAERFIAVDGKAIGYGLKLTCGEQCDTAVVKTFQELDFDPAARPVTVRTDGDMRFSMLHLLFNHDQWDSFGSRYKEYFRGKQWVGLERPRQVIVLNDNGHARTSTRQDNIILRDLKQNVFRDSFELVRDWPEYRLPVYLVAVRKLDGGWVLIAEMDEYYFIEDRSFAWIVKREHM
jgi:hypothetical protein